MGKNEKLLLWQQGDTENSPIHICEESCFGRTTIIVFTKCGIDVPGGESFRSWEEPTCEKCKGI